MSGEIFVTSSHRGLRSGVFPRTSEQVLLITVERKKASLGGDTSFGLEKILTRDKKTALVSPPLSLFLSPSFSLHPESNMDLSNDSTHDRCRVTHPGQPSKKIRSCM